MNRPIVLGLAMLTAAAIGATAVNGLHAQNKAPGAYAVLELIAINSPTSPKRFLQRPATSTAIPPDWAEPSLTARVPIA